MDISFQVDSEVLSIVLGVCLTFLIVLIWFEVKKGKPYLWARLIAVFFVVVSLAMLLLHPGIYKNQETNSALLICEGSSSFLVDSLKEHFKPALLIDLREKQITANVEQFNQEEIIIYLQSYDNWLVSGAEIPIEFEPYLEDKEVIYFPSGFKNGWQDFRYPQKVTENSSWEVNAQYYLDSLVTVKLSLEIAGNIVDSLLIQGKGFHEIYFTTNLEIPKGKYLFNLISESEKDTTHQPLPVVITPEKKANYLIVSGYPSFEWKYLKDYLTDEGNQLFYRSKISKDKYITEALNTDAAPKITFNRDFLTQFDVFLFDKAGWQDLTFSQKALFKKLSAETGTGLLLLTFGDNFTNTDFFKQGSLAWVQEQKNTFSFNVEKTNDLIVLTDISVVLKKTKQFELLLKNGTDEALAAYKQLSFGRQSIAVFPPLYPFILQGESQKFKHVYQALLDQLYKPIYSEKYWDFSSKPIMISGNKANLKLKTIGVTKIQELTALITKEGDDAIRLAPTQDPIVGDDFNYSFYPVEAGWYQVALQQDTTVRDWLYIYPDSLIQSVSTTLQIVENLNKWGNGHKSGASFTTSEIKKLWVIPQWYFFIILLLSLSSLWLLDKIYS